MGDEWEENRLERREDFKAAHRFRVDAAETEVFSNKRAAVDLLSDQLLWHTKQFRSAISELISLVQLSPEMSKQETLRAAYSRISRDPYIQNADRDGGFEQLTSSVDRSRKVSETFGSIVANIMGINRCILSLNSAQLGLDEIESKLYENAVAASGMFSRDLDGKVLEVELWDGQKVRVSPPASRRDLKPVSMDSVIADLRHWTAI